MKVQTKLLLMVGFLVLAMPLTGWAAPVGTFSSDLSSSQTFYGDGAVYGDGYLQLPPANNKGDKCLQCHQGIPADFNPSVIIPDKRFYLRTGHGNMVKKVTSPPQKWRGALGELYPTTSAGHPINWTTGKVDLGGYCDVGGFEGQFLKSTCEATTACTLDASNNPAAYSSSASCIAAGGQWKKGKWTAATRLADITFLIGDWMSIDAPDTGITGAGLPANKFMMADGRQYGTCGSCHTAGYKAGDWARVQPFADYPNYPRSSASGVAGSWVLDGIQCERCHDATKHYASPFTATVAQGAASTALCSQCHIRPGAWESPNTNNPNAASQPTAYPIGASATNFGSHLIGKQFLNSPHGLFYGSYTQIADTAAGQYKSRFSDGTRQGGCDTCHDVHQSTIVKIYPEGPEEGDLAQTNSSPKPLSITGTPEPIRRECIVCHSEKGELWNLKHPSGAGTPQAEGPKVSDSCKVCHMPKPPQPGGAEGLYVHVFRINTDPKYSTFPKTGATTPGICANPYYKTKAECVANVPINNPWSLVANSAPDGRYENAVWVDLDLACGKCHGADGEAKPLSKRQLAQFAKGMHGVNSNPNTPPKAAMTASPAVTGYTVTFTDKSTDAEDKPYDLRISVTWGDGAIDTGFSGSTFLHTYDFSGTFTIRHKATDTAGLSGFESVSVVISD
jgi:hypothetical protein